MTKDRERLLLIVIKNSLNIENELSEIIKILLGLHEKENLKTLGSRGSALSFRNKADLLYDIDKITKKVYNNLCVFTEIRNQILHNLDCETLEIASKRTGNYKKLLPLNKNDSKHELDDEYKLKLAFELLCNELNLALKNVALEIIREKMEALEQIRLKDANRLAENYFKYLLNSIGEIVKETDDMISDEQNESGIANIIGQAIVKRFIEKTKLSKSQIN